MLRSLGEVRHTIVFPIKFLTVLNTNMPESLPIAIQRDAGMTVGACTVSVVKNSLWYRLGTWDRA